MHKTVDVRTHPQARPLRPRRRILGSLVIAAVVVIGCLGTMTIRDRYNTGPDAPSASPAAAQTQDPTLAELNEMWAPADAALNAVELPSTVDHARAQVTAETDASLWAIIDHEKIMGS